MERDITAVAAIVVVDNNANSDVVTVLDMAAMCDGSGGGGGTARHDRRVCALWACCGLHGRWFVNGVVGSSMIRKRGWVDGENEELNECHSLSQ